MEKIDNFIRQVQAGETEKFREIIRATQSQLRAFLALHCPNYELIDEIAQETYVWAYEHLFEYQPNTNFLAWLKTIGKYKLMEELKRRKREAEHQQKIIEHYHVSKTLEILPHVETNSSDVTIEKLKQCLQNLPQHHRSIILQRYWKNTSIRDLTSLYKQSESAIKTLLFRIRQALKTCLEKHEGEVSYL